MMMDGYFDDDLIRSVLGSVRTIAVVGASPNPMRPSNNVTEFLVAAGYDVYPVNPGHGGEFIAGRLVFERLADVPVPVDMVDVFRRSEALPALVDEVLALEPRPRALWTQLGVVHDEATDRAAAAGLQVVVDRSPAIEYPRLFRRVARRVPPAT